MALMRARHKDLNVVAEVPDNDYYRDKGWSKVSDDTLTTVEAELEAEAAAFVAKTTFDPSAHKAEEVVDHINSAAADEVDRVIEAERTGKARKTVLEQA